MLLSSAASADQIEVSYDIGVSPGGLGGFAGSFAHTADGCEGASTNSGGPLLMCPDPEVGQLWSIEGVLTSIFDTDTGILLSIGGFLDIDGTTLYFEDLGIAPNQLSEDFVILWGHDLGAYCLGGADFEQSAYFANGSVAGGIDIDSHGTPWASVPEPGTLALPGVGLLGLSTSRRLMNAQGLRHPVEH